MPTTRPKSGMKRPSTPASFIRLSAVSGSASARSGSRGTAGWLRDRRAAAASMRFSDWVTSRVASGWIGRFERSATQKRRMRLTGSRSNTSAAKTLTRSDVDLEVLGVGDRAGPAAKPADEAVEHRRRLGLALLERGADDRCQVADILGDQEIVLHEALDVGLAGAGRIAELSGDRPLHVEAQALLGSAGEEMQIGSAPTTEIPRSGGTGRTRAARTAPAATSSCGFCTR